MIDHAIICIWNLYDAAKSRKNIQSKWGTDSPVAGGLWETSNPKDQKAVLAQLFYRLIFRLTEHDVPLTFLHFPRFANDHAYFMKKIPNVFGGIDTAHLDSAFGQKCARN